MGIQEGGAVGGINLQNLGGRGRTGSGIDPLIGAMRSLLCAPDGYIFSIVDSAQIEARILAWIAGQSDLIEGFKNDEDVYSTFASYLFGCNVRRPIDSDDSNIRKTLKIRRGFGKDAILGCGYGMGADKFFIRCRQNDDLRPLFDSGGYNWLFIDKLIKTYRNTYAKIPEFWKTVEKCFKWVVKYPHEVMRYYVYRGTDTTLHGPDLLTFWNNNGTVHIQLPSGRTLNYRHCKLDSKGTIRWHYGKLWGGAITENIIQAIARDLFGYWILKCEKAKLPVILHAHDEIICLVADQVVQPNTAQQALLEGAKMNTANLDLNAVINIMRQCPVWAEGLPLDAEGELSGVYKK